MMTSRQDSHRRPQVLFWEVTRACQLQCQHCRAEAQPHRDADELTLAEAKSMLQAVRNEFGPILLVLTGGDPLERSDLFDVIRYGSNLGLHMAITPSATALLTEDVLVDLQAAGIQRLALSVDGADAATHDQFRGVDGSFERTMRMLGAAQRLQIPLQINTSVSPINKHQLYDIADLARWFEIAMWSVFFTVPTGRADESLSLAPQEHEQLYLQLAKLDCDETVKFKIKTTAAPAYYRVKYLLQKQRGLVPEDGIGAGANDGKGVMFVDHRGNIQPSGFLPMQRGNIRTHDIAHLYRHDQVFKALRDPSQYPGKCRVCAFNDRCGGSRSRAYAMTGNALASDPSCPYFPERWKSTEITAA